MSCPPAATLQTVALDAYHRQLLARMLDLLNPRLRWTWHASDSESGAATLVDVDDERGRRHALAALGSGLAGRTIAFGGRTDLGARHRVAKPLRLAPLLAALSAIEDDPAAAPDVTGDPACFRLLDWPAHAAGTAPVPMNELRISALLARRPLGIADICGLLDLARDEAGSLLAGLAARGLVARQAALPSPLPPPAAPRLRGLVATLRRRFGF